MGFALFSTFLGFQNSSQQPNPRLAIGATAPLQSLEMTGVDDNQHSLSSIAQANGLLVIFTSNVCNYVVGDSDMEGWNNRYDFYNRAATNLDYGIVLVNSNELNRATTESLSVMQTLATANNYQMPYVVDTDGDLANAFGAETTPDVFLFDENFELIYEGAIDANPESNAEVMKQPLIHALEQGLKNYPVTISSTPNVGCDLEIQ